MVAASLINYVEADTDCQIHIDFNIDLEHFNFNPSDGRSIIDITLLKSQ